MSKEFKTQHMQELKAQEKIQVQTPLGGVPLDQGLSYSARFQNFKKEKYSIQYEVASASSGPGASPLSGGRSSLALEAAAAAQAEVDARELVNKESFLKGVAELDHQIQDMSRSILLSHLEKNSAQDKQDAKAEEARKRKEAELRRARKKEQNARDPKRKVALRIQNQRNFASFQAADPTVPKAKKDDIPIVKYEVHSLQGAEKVAIVDVMKIQNQCESLNQPFVQHMLEVRERSERLERYSQFASTSSIVSGGSSMSYDERALLAQQIRKGHHADKMLDKMSMMRSQWQYQLPYELELDPDGDVRSRGETAFLDPQAQKKPQDQKALAKALSHKIGKRLEVNGGRRGCVLGALSMLSALGGRIEDLPTPRTLEKQQAVEARRAEKDLKAQKELDVALRLRVRRRWAILKAHVQWLILLFSHRKQHRSADVLVGVLKQMGEWARIKSAMKNTFASVKKIQRSVQLFLKVRAKRVGACEKDWHRLEDYYLNLYFKGAAKEAVQAAKEESGVANKGKAQSKMMTKEKRDRQEILNVLEAGVSKGEVAINWRDYKIPAPVRKAIIQRWYITGLRKYVRSQAQIVATFKESMQHERELMSFLNSFGVDPKQKRLPDLGLGGRAGKQAAVNDDDNELPWYVMPEAFILKAIAVAAQAMDHDELFHDHPANRELGIERKDGPVYNSQVDLHRVFATAVLKVMEKPCNLGRFGKKIDQTHDEDGQEEGTGSPGKGHSPEGKPAMAAGPADTGKRKVSIANTSPTSGANDMDIEEIFKSFTPRIREIYEEQSSEYDRRRNIGTEEEADDSLV